ncbi:hypothetical protein OAT16_05315 [Prolixibacteraceae bacterium]|nr:hypothetical protein [Prolixibacteraceae bacterium]
MVYCTRITILSILMLFSVFASAKSNWAFRPNIVFHRYKTCQGMIAQKYPITIYLETSTERCSGSACNWAPQMVYGWYMYNKIGKKIPLVGNSCYADACDIQLRLFVPEDPTDYHFDEKCNLIGAKESFVQQNGWKTDSMVWRMGKGKYYPVSLQTTHAFDWNTQAYLELEINEIGIKTVDLNTLTHKQSIEKITILSQKKVENQFHVIFSYSELSNPYADGRGHCGGGIELHIGHITLNKSYEVVKFNSIYKSSCINSFDKEVIYDKAHPEEGIKEKVAMP